MALPWVGAIGSGLLQVLPYPLAGPVPLWRAQISWLALTPLLWVLLGGGQSVAPGLTRSALLGYASGVIWYLGNCYWILQTMHIYGGLSLPVATGILLLFSLYLGLYHAMFAALLSFIRRAFGAQRALLAVPAIWVAVEMARTHITGFPWDLLGIAQVDGQVLTRLAPWTGVYGLSFLIAGVNALWLMRVELRDRRWTRPALTVAGVALIGTLVLLTLHPPPAEAPGSRPATATLLQENLEVGAAAAGAPPETESELLAAFTSLSERPSATLLNGIPEVPETQTLHRQVSLRPGGALAAGEVSRPEEVRRLLSAVEHTNVVLWPESPAPFAENQPAFRDTVSELARTMNAPVIVGNIGTDRVRQGSDGRAAALYNSASFVTSQGEFSGRYDKMHLVPFGEYTPFRRLFFFAGHLLDEVGTFQPGAQRRIFGPFGVFICYESIFGDEVRQFPKLGAAVLINLSNDGWYGDTSAPWQHLNMVRMRAVENHRWVLRATNTGITAAIDPAGHVVASAPRHVRTAIRVPFRFEQDLTFYARHGDVFAWACTVASASLMVGALVRLRRMSR